MTKSKLETDIFNYKTPEFYINMKSIPDKTSQERKSFVLEEKRKCKEGININGIYIPGGLYMHLNYYHLEGDDKDNPGKKKIMLPTLRDNEWIIFNDYDFCQKEGKIYPLFGGRQISKTETEVSLCLRELSLYTPTEAVALFANDQYKDTFVKKARTALYHGEKFIYVPNIDKDWNKNEIRFGLTRQDNSIDLRGTLYIYNTQEGKKIQVGSGKSPSFLLFDEAAASPFNGVLNTMLPAMLTDFGNLRCSPMITFTGGETDKAEDAKNMVENPSEDKQFTTILEDGRKIGGRFMDGRYRKDCKKPSTISQYTGIKTDTWVDDYPIMVTDFNYAVEKIDKEREEASKHPDKTTLTLQKIFFPLTIDDVFLRESGNKFPIEPIKQHKIWLKEHFQPIYAELYRDMQGKVLWKNSGLKPITKFPVKPADDKEAPFCIVEFPIPDAPRYTYCIGIDPINDDESNDKVVSLFSLYVYKRMISPMDKFKNQVVAWRTFRTKELKDTHEFAVMVAEFYNAIEGVLPEGSEASLIQHFMLKRKSNFLAETINLQTTIVKRNIKGAKKVSLPPTTPNQRHYMGLLVEAANEEIIEVNEEGEEEFRYGVSREYDTMLLEEYEQYRGKTTGRGVHDGNFDRIIARGCAETLARYYDVKYPIAQYINLKEPDNQPYRRKAIPTVFGMIELKPKNQSIIQEDKPKKKLPNWMRGKRF